MLSSHYVIDHSDHGEADACWDQHSDLDSHAMLADPYPEPEPTRGVVFDMPSTGLDAGFPSDWIEADGSWGDEKLNSTAQDCLKLPHFQDFDMFSDEEEAPPPPSFFTASPSLASATATALQTATQAATAATQAAATQAASNNPNRLATPFLASDLAPRLTSQPLVSLAPTHVECRSTSAAGAGNALQACLLALQPAEPLEVNREKCRVKATFSYGEITCTLKIYIFEVASGHFLLEVTRWAGDSLYFVAVFQRLKTLLEATLP